MLAGQIYQFVSLDLAPLLAALFACLSCALLGNFLVLRKLSLMGDAISHAVLPGIVGAFLLSGSRDSFVIFIGAAIAGVITAVTIELVRSFGRLDSGAAMGVVFSIMFALGVLLMEQAAARNVDLDADCLLHGQLETIFWYPPALYSELFSLKTIALIPNEVITSLVVFLLAALFVALLYKELALTAFDPALATALGFNAKKLHYALMLVVAAAVVASFKVVGSILVIAMIICPAATARFYTDKLRVQIILSLVFTFFSVTVGYVLAGYGHLWLGYKNAVNAGGMMTVVVGACLFFSALFAPVYGIVSRQVRRFALSLKVYRQDILASVYRHEEVNNKALGFSIEKMYTLIPKNLISHLALRGLLSRGELEAKLRSLYLTDKGRAVAQELIRSHRLWESFLVEQAGLQPDHVHSSASQLEHYTHSDLSQRLAEQQSHNLKDPHGKPIP